MTRPYLALGAVLGFAATPILACEQAEATQAALNAKDTAAVEKLHEEMSLNPSCDQSYTKDIADWLAQVYLREAGKPDTSFANKHEALSKSFAYQKHWRTVAIRGQLYWDAKEYENAARSLDVALDLVAEGDPSHEISEEDFRKLHRLYTQSIALASDAAPGKNAFRNNFRNFVVEEVPSHITFKFNSTEFDRKGLGFANGLLKHLLIHQPSKIELDGHTDPKGSESYNLQLSLARAESVRTFLTENGFKGEVIVRGLGESQVPPPPDGYEEGSEEHYQIARRVTFKES